jgi:septum formation protein
MVDDYVVIGCDSTLYRNGELVGKPHSAGAARRQWQQMAGGEGDLYTGIASFGYATEPLPTIAVNHSVPRYFSAHRRRRNWMPT